jgi:hypothetical protein
MHRLARTACAAIVAAIVACGPPSSSGPGADGGREGGIDGSAETGADATTDAGTEAAPLSDAAGDAFDAWADAGHDAGLAEAGDADAGHSADAADAAEASDAADAAVLPCACAPGQICVGGTCQAPSGTSCSCTGWQVCTATGQCVAPPEQASFRTGACYHDTGAWKPGASPGTWDVSSANVFVPLYDQPGVRQTVRQQLQAIADAGAAFVKTILWYGDNSTPPTYPNWEMAFPPTNQQLANLHDYVADVSTTLRPDGTPMELLLSSGWLTDSDLSIGDVTKGKVGWSCLTPTDYGQRVVQSYTGVLDAVKTVYRADGLPAVSLMYLWSEVEVCATDDDTDPGCQWLLNSQPDACKVSPSLEAPMRDQQWFLTQFYPGFVQAARTAGIIPSVYFNGGNPESNVLDGAFGDPFATTQPDFAVLAQHRSMALVFRSAWWMKQHGLPVPPRFDFDFFPVATVTTPATLDARVLDDLEAVLPTLYPGQPVRYGVVETRHPVDATARDEVGKAWSAERLARGSNPEVVAFWSTPGGIVDDNVAPAQFDFSAFTTSGLVFPFASLNGGFETSASGTLPDHWTSLVPASTASNAFWNTTGVRFGSADLRFDASRCASGCASVESDPVGVSPGQVVAFHLWQENDQPPLATGSPTDASTGGMTLSIVPVAAGTDGSPILQFSPAGNAPTYGAPFSQAWARYAGVVPVPAGVTAVRMRVGMNGTSSTTTMDLDEVK